MGKQKRDRDAIYIPVNKQRDETPCGPGEYGQGVEMSGNQYEGRYPGKKNACFGKCPRDSPLSTPSPSRSAIRTHLGPSSSSLRSATKWIRRRSPHRSALCPGGTGSATQTMLVSYTASSAAKVVSQT